MHRHGYKGRKFGRERDQRRALLRGLMKSLVIHTSITTTLPKAKELRPKMEKVISKARKGDLSSRRRVIAALSDVRLGNFLVDVVAPQIKRNSGYLRIKKLDENRVGDNAEMATIEFVDEIKTSPSEAAEATPTEEKPAAKTSPTAKKEDK
ncbi:MAG: 50S ribosomal protein L17 [Candidatus Nomurabacteria bacterium]|jgi:large subunit ribosomal protein L17|nr:50S ribosomal protein L17 [Candidatus Nomurabacteria bacterium]